MLAFTDSADYRRRIVGPSQERATSTEAAFFLSSPRDFAGAENNPDGRDTHVMITPSPAFGCYALTTCRSYARSANGNTTCRDVPSPGRSERATVAWCASRMRFATARPRSGPGRSDGFAIAP